MGESRAAEQNISRSFLASNFSLLAAVLIYVTIVAVAYLRFGTLPEITLGRWLS